MVRMSAQREHLSSCCLNGWFHPSTSSSPGQAPPLRHLASLGPSSSHKQPSSSTPGLNFPDDSVASAPKAEKSRDTFPAWFGVLSHRFSDSSST